MLKIAVLVVLACCVYGVQSNCGPPCKHSDRTICAADGQIKSCQRLTECELRRENCRRRQSHRSLLSNVAPSRCRKLSKRGKGPCASVHRRPKRNSPPTCNQLPCVSKEVVCARSKNSLCQTVTRCQLDSINCKRGPLNHLQVTNRRHCKGLKLGGKLQKCRK